MNRGTITQLYFTDGAIELSRDCEMEIEAGDKLTVYIDKTGPEPDDVCVRLKRDADAR